MAVERKDGCLIGVNSINTSEDQLNYLITCNPLQNSSSGKHFISRTLSPLVRSGHREVMWDSGGQPGGLWGGGREQCGRSGRGEPAGVPCLHDPCRPLPSILRHPRPPPGRHRGGQAAPSSQGQGRFWTGLVFIWSCSPCILISPCVSSWVYISSRFCTNWHRLFTVNSVKSAFIHTTHSWNLLWVLHPLIPPLDGYYFEFCSHPQYILVSVPVPRGAPRYLKTEKLSCCKTSCIQFLLAHS